ncbi:MAG: hypothetical protein M1828_003696 [Chrysothrix sp. TS-e1954]|nr:MAG: hypothetical protein M1828_003696 [Chrysothrix sp. TS-e1954]
MERFNQIFYETLKNFAVEYVLFDAPSSRPENESKLYACAARKDIEPWIDDFYKSVRRSESLQSPYYQLVSFINNVSTQNPTSEDFYVLMSRSSTGIPEINHWHASPQTGVIWYTIPYVLGNFVNLDELRELHTQGLPEPLLWHMLGQLCKCLDALHSDHGDSREASPQTSLGRLALNHIDSQCIRLQIAPGRDAAFGYPDFKFTDFWGLVRDKKQDAESAAEAKDDRGVVESSFEAVARADYAKLGRVIHAQAHGKPLANDGTCQCPTEDKYSKDFEQTLIAIMSLSDHTTEFEMTALLSSIEDRAKREQQSHPDARLPRPVQEGFLRLPSLSIVNTILKREYPEVPLWLDFNSAGELMDDMEMA